MIRIIHYDIKGFTGDAEVKKLIVICLTLWGLVFFSFSLAIAGQKAPVYVSILPQKFFVESIGGQLVEVSVMVTPGANPHDYEPSPSQMKTLSTAKIYFAIGDPFEDAWLKKITIQNSSLKVVHTEDGIEKKPINRNDPLLRSPAESLSSELHKHAHDINDPHIWLSPPFVMLQARNILVALISEFPDQQTVLENNYKQFINQLVDLDAQLRLLFKDDAGKQFMVLHPAWGYFADAYNIRQISIECEGKEPKAKDLQQLIQYARNHGIRDVFVQPQFSTKNAETIAKEINAKLIPADDLSENWLENIKTVAVSIKQALR